MKRVVVAFISVLFSLNISAQTYMEGFESGSLPSGWDTLNLSGPTPGTVPAWFPSTYFISPPAAQEGSLFYASNYEAEGNNGTVSSWLFTPVRTFNSGDIFSFFTRTVANSVQYPDRMEIRMTTNGSGINAGSSPSSVGDYTMQLATINPNLTLTGYPTTWTKYSISLSGLPVGGISGRIAFRYYVTNSGPNGVNGDGIGIDSVHYQPNLGVGISNTGLEQRYRFFPNPSLGKIQISFPIPSSDRELIVMDMKGEVMFRCVINQASNSVDLSSLSKGAYFLNIKEGNSVAVEKLILE